MDNQFVKVGKILKSKGFDGTMRVAFDYDLLEDSFKAFFLEKKGVYSPYLIEKLDFDGESALVKFTKIKSKEAVKSNINFFNILWNTAKK
jgi:ribosomal 30S subunit maturation factor RimM